MDNKSGGDDSARREELGRRVLLMGSGAALLTLLAVQAQRDPVGSAAAPAGADTIARHHALLAQLLKELPYQEHPGRALETARRIRYLVSAHLYAEEHSLYPLAHQSGLHEDMREVFADHADQTLRAAELERLLHAGEMARARSAAGALREQVVRHSTEEERGIYRDVTDRWGSEVVYQYERAFASVRPGQVRWLP
ncbi:hemerythrin domain-containing protein [Ramlibacter sp. AN1015]|uniref:hemerythrin domain-containing protein n=1 Tax=Ramlibacter sp. AN1015 TaxID=3133428 RepID=UPI0030C630BD